MTEENKKIKKVIPKEPEIEQPAEIAEEKKELPISPAEKKDVTEDSLGEIRIAPEVLATIVSRTVGNIPGVAGLVSHAKSGFGTLLGVKEIEEGIKVDLVDEKKTMSAYISVIVEYGAIIIEVAKRIQSVVKSEIEKNTGLQVKSVDINIMGIQMAGKK